MKHKTCLACKTNLKKTSWVILDGKEAYCLKCYEEDEMGWL